MSMWVAVAIAILLTNAQLCALWTYSKSYNNRSIPLNIAQTYLEPLCPAQKPPRSRNLSQHLLRFAKYYYSYAIFTAHAEVRRIEKEKGARVKEDSAPRMLYIYIYIYAVCTRDAGAYWMDTTVDRRVCNCVYMYIICVLYVYISPYLASPQRSIIRMYHVPTNNGQFSCHFICCLPLHPPLVHTSP